MAQFLRFPYAAIKRYGARRWVADRGFIEFNTAYVVSVSEYEGTGLTDGHESPYIVELSNGTKFLTFLHEYGRCPEDSILSPDGAEYATYADDALFTQVEGNLYQLN